VNRWGKISFSILSAFAAVACTATVAPVNGPVVPIAPSIGTQPTNQTVTAGQAATFTVLANGTAPLTYQWQKNGTNIAGATSVSYTTSATTTSDSGSTFDVVVSNSAGTATSNPATLTVNPAALAATITTQPANQTVTVGQTATFSVAASGTAPLSGATSASYTTPATSSSDNGALFNMVVSNASGSVTSNTATLTVNAASQTLQVTTTQLAGATLSGAYSATLSASGGTTPYAWSLASGSLPTGITLSSVGTVSGTPASAGSFLFTVQVTDAASHSASTNLPQRGKSRGFRGHRFPGE
jgi:hypothetical protein